MALMGPKSELLVLLMVQLHVYVLFGVSVCIMQVVIFSCWVGRARKGPFQSGVRWQQHRQVCSGSSGVQWAVQSGTVYYQIVTAGRTDILDMCWTWPWIAFWVKLRASRFAEVQ